MKLWTWQNPVFDITDPSTPVDSQKHSQYDYMEAYKKLREKYGTDQILWCYCSFEDATSFGALGYNGMILWELEVPEYCFLDVTCAQAWNLIISDMACMHPKQFENLFFVLKGLMAKGNIAYYHDDFSSDFNQYWIALNQEDLFDVFSVNLQTCKAGCPTIILRHPVENDWVVNKQSYDALKNIRKY